MSLLDRDAKNRPRSNYDNHNAASSTGSRTITRLKLEASSIHCNSIIERQRERGVSRKKKGEREVKRGEEDEAESKKREGGVKEIALEFLPSGSFLLGSLVLSRFFPIMIFQE